MVKTRLANFFDGGNKPPKNILFLSCILVFVAQLGATLYLPALPSIGKSLKMSQELSSYSLVIYFLGCAIPILLWGVIIELYGRKTTLIVALAIFTIMSFFITVASTGLVFIVARFIQGIGAGGMAIIGRVLIRDAASGAWLTRSMTLLSFSFISALGGGQFLGGFLQQYFYWQVDFWMLTTLGLFLMLLVSFFNITTRTQSRSSLKMVIPYYFRILRSQSFVYPMLIGALGYGILVSFQSIAPFLFQNIFKMNPQQFGNLGILFGLSYLAGSLLVNRLALSIGNIEFMKIGMLIIFSGTIVLIGLAYFTQDKSNISPFIMFVLIAYCAITFGQAIVFPNSMAAALDSVDEHGSYATALCSFSQQIIATAIGGLTSMIMSLGLLSIGLVFMFLAGIGLILMNKNIFEQELIVK